jgi:outer membrane biosynthesis protein TonB
MSTLTRNAPELPWNDSDHKNFRIILVAFLAIVLAASFVIPKISLPEIKRTELEKVPPFLAKVIKRKKLEKPKVKPKPKPAEKKLEKKPEPKKVEEKPKPKPKPKQKPKPKKEVPKKKRIAAKETAKKAFGSDALAALSSIQSSVPIAALNTSSKGLSNNGSKATNVGSVVDRDAASRGSGGVSVAALTTATVGQDLSARDVTSVELSSEDIEIEETGRSRSQEELRLVFEQHKSSFDRLYRKALRKNAALEGSVTLKLEILPSGKVSSCKVSNSELKDTKLEKRLASRCRLIGFANKANIDIAVVEFPIRFIP